MPRYERDYGPWNEQGRYPRDQPGGQGSGYGRGGWGAGWANLPGEGAWMGESYGGPRPGYDYDYGGGFGSGYGGYGRDFASGRGGYGGGADRGQTGREFGYGGGFAYYGGQGGGYQAPDRGAQRQGNDGAGMRAVDIMTEQPRAVSPDTTVAEVAQMMRDLDVGIIPVVESEQSRRLRGVITDRDITIRATAEGKDARTTRVSEVMSPDVETVNKNDRVRDVLEVMRRERVKRVPVTDREGRLVGIIAEADLLADFEGREQEQMLENTLERVYQPDRSPRRSRSARAEAARPDAMAAGGRGFEDEAARGTGRSPGTRKRTDQE